jgi:cyclopropane-fatty-acyl-phospholipid synthase
MSFLATVIDAAERAPLPDPVLRLGVTTLVAGARRRLARAPVGIEADFARDMAGRALAEHTEAANDQHYELPAAFFRLILGPRLKYSSCFYSEDALNLAAAEEAALAQTCEHAGLKDGQSILELGCGWGSLSLWMAETLPNARVTAVSNSASQKAFIDTRAKAQGLDNLTIITADMNDFEPAGRFDRIVSVEMFEHMSNWRALLGRVRRWLAPGGRLFVHVFSHRRAPYRFDHADPADWIGRYFFTGGVMPSHGLMTRFDDLFRIEADWRWSGRHYQRTALDWLENYDRNGREVMAVLQGVYGQDATLWFRRWRLFFLATAGLFGHAGGGEWGVSHYRLRPS